MMGGTLSGVALAILIPAVAQPQALEIDHKAVGCIVVGKYPKMNACFTPAANMARSRVYFRPEGAASWYYVDMKSEQPCFTGTLPKPGKKLVGKKIEYYVEAQNKTFEPSRTAEFDPVVVRSAQECKKNVPVAPFLNNATVAVFPSVPAGFVGAGTIGTAAVVGIVGAGAAVAGTAAVVASNSDDTTTTTLAVGINTTTTTTTTLAPTTTTTTTLPATNHAPFAVLTTSPDPPSGNGPLTVTFDLCKSTDPDKDALNFFFDFGDGGKTSGSCLESHTYQSSLREASNVRALDRSFIAEACVVDSGGLSACRTRTVNVTTTPPPTTAPKCPTPTVSINDPPSVFGCDISVAAPTTNTDAVNICAEASSCGALLSTQSQAMPIVCKAGTPDGSTFYATLTVSSGGCYLITANATNSCGGKASAAPVLAFVSYCSGPFRAGSASAVLLSSDLKMEGTRLQLIVNGNAASYPERGRSFGMIRIQDGENRVEGTVVDTAGKAGTLTIELSGESIQAGSIRVLAGTVESIGATAVTFKLKGTPDERIGFTFVKK